MASVKNKITRSIRPASVFASAKGVIGTLTANQGDLICLKSNVLAAGTAESDGATFLGILPESVSSGKLVSPYTTDVSGQQALADVPGPVFGVIAKVILKTGDTLNPGDAVYLDPVSGTRNVQASGTKIIGCYQGSGAVTGAASSTPTEIECLLGSRYPADTLKF